MEPDLTGFGAQLLQSWDKRCSPVYIDFFGWLRYSLCNLFARTHRVYLYRNTLCINFAQRVRSSSRALLRDVWPRLFCVLTVRRLFETLSLWLEIL